MVKVTHMSQSGIGQADEGSWVVYPLLVVWLSLNKFWPYLCLFACFWCIEPVIWMRIFLESPCLQFRDSCYFPSQTVSLCLHLYLLGSSSLPLHHLENVNNPLSHISTAPMSTPKPQDSSFLFYLPRTLKNIPTATHTQVCHDYLCVFYSTLLLTHFLSAWIVALWVGIVFHTLLELSTSLLSVGSEYNRINFFLPFIPIACKHLGIWGEKGVVNIAASQLLRILTLHPHFSSLQDGFSSVRTHY